MPIVEVPTVVQNAMEEYIAKFFKNQPQQGHAANFLSVIHPNASVSQGVTLGEGIYLGWNVGISCDVKIGNFVSLNGNITAGHDAVIEDYVEMGPGFAHIEREYISVLDA